jgi:nitrogen fixation protein NifM
MIVSPPDRSPYLTLKLAQQLYAKSPDGLAPAERERVADVARRQTEIEQRILSTVEASGAVVPPASVEGALAEIRGRYGSDDDYRADLERVGLDPGALRDAIARDLKVEAVLEQVAGRMPPVSDTDVEIFYLQHTERFRKPETRTLRHILLTINDDITHGDRATAYARIGEIHARLEREPARFAEQALKHSECPTAMNGGLLGNVPRGKLYAEVEEVAFALGAGELSGIIESPMGFHVVLCDAIEPERSVPLDEARERIREHLAQGRRIAFQKNWIAGLGKPG